MATFTSIYGDEISVWADTRKNLRQYSAFAGAIGLTAMSMGTRGRPIVISGRIRVAIATNYDAARTAMDAAIAVIEAYGLASAATYTFRGSTYNNCVCDDPFRVIPNGTGKAYYVAGGYLICLFQAIWRELI